MRARGYVLLSAISAIVGAGIACGIILPILGDERARADERATAYNDAISTIADNRRELDEARSALARAESANIELASRLSDATNTTSRGVETGRTIAIGIDGDLDELGLARDSIRSAIETVGRLSLNDGKTD